MANEQNLIPAKKGEVRNPKGKPKGTKHLSTWIQNMLNDEEFETIILDGKKGVIDYKGAPIKAIISVAIIKALNDKNGQQWAEWLAKHGYGNNVNVNVKVNPVEQILKEIKLLDDGQDQTTEEDTPKE